MRRKAALEKKTPRSLAYSLSMMRADASSRRPTASSSPDGASKITHFNEKYLQMWRIPREVMEGQDLRRALIGRHRASAQRSGGLRHGRRRDQRVCAEERATTVLDFADGRAFERFHEDPVRRRSRTSGRVWCFRDNHRAQGPRPKEQRQVLPRIAPRPHAMRRTPRTARRTRFLSIVSHELRTPAERPSRDGLRLLLSGDLSAEKRLHAIQVIDRNAKGAGQAHRGSPLDVSPHHLGKGPARRPRPVDPA